MQDKFKLATRGKFCMRSMRPFLDGETFYSLLVPPGEYAPLVSPELLEMERQQAAQAAQREAAREAAQRAAAGLPPLPPPASLPPGAAAKPAKPLRPDPDETPATLLRRVDLAEALVAEADRAQAVVFWKTVFVAAKSKKKQQAFPIDTQGLIDLFLKLEDDIAAGADQEEATQRDRIQLRYVVALMLLRKRKLRLLEFRTDKAGREWMVVMQAGGTRRLKVRVIPIAASDRDRLRVELVETLGLSEESLGEAAPATPATPPTPPTPGAPNGAADGATPAVSAAAPAAGEETSSAATATEERP